MYRKSKIATVFALVVTLLINLIPIQPASAAVLRCDANGGDRREQNRIDAVRLSAEIGTSPPTITLNWQPHDNATGYNIYRKTRDALDWGSPTAAGIVTTWTDNAVAIGDVYEYRVERTGSGCTQQDGYILAGLNAPLNDDRGKLILLVDDTFSVSLADKLSRLEDDLRGDGWQVLRHDLPRSATQTDVKATIQTNYALDPTNVKAVFIFGHLAVPYSGMHATDEHELRAWPSDTYYADMDGTWSDSNINTNGNVPNDGIWDVRQITPKTSGADTAPELIIGRVDLHDLPAFAPLTETELMARYLDKNHAFRHKQTSVRMRGIIMDKFGEGAGWETPGVAQWTSMTPLVGNGEHWFDEPTSNSGSQYESGTYMMHYRKDKYFNTDGYIMADVSGFASNTEIYDSYKTVDYSTDMPPVIFLNKFGSYFGEWDSSDNLLRAPLAGETYGLATVWGGWGTWTYHHMGLGEPIGNTVKATHHATVAQSSGGHLYNTWYTHTRPEMSLMGDPTLRMHMVEPVSGLSSGSRGADLSWDAPRESVDGYHVYRADSPTGKFTRLTSEPITTTNYNDSSVSSGIYTYMVRAISLETTPSGSFYNASQGQTLTTEASNSAPTAITVAGHSVSPQNWSLVLAAILVIVGGTGAVYSYLSSQVK